MRTVRNNTFGCIYAHAGNASLNLDDLEHLPRHPPSTDEH
jgi:hypothetical protein